MSNKIENKNKKVKSKVKLLQKVKAFSKVNASIISMTIIYVLITILASFYLITNVNAEWKKDENPAAPIDYVLTLAYNDNFTYSGVSFPPSKGTPKARYEDISWFPIGKRALGYTVDAYCGERGVEWGTNERFADTSKSDAYKYHVDHPFNQMSTFNKLVKEKKGDLNGLKQYDLDEWAQLIVEDNENPPFVGAAADSIVKCVWDEDSNSFKIKVDPEVTIDGLRHQMSSSGGVMASEDGIIHLYTNWCYRPVEFSYTSSHFNSDGSITEGEFWAEDGQGPINGSHGTGSGNYYIGDLGISYILATVKVKSEPGNIGGVKHPQIYNYALYGADSYQQPYQNDPIQYAVWNWLGYDLGSGGRFKNSEYIGLGKAFEAYSEESKDPNVTAYPDENVGTTISNDNSTYVVGPFLMSEYVRAKTFGYGAQDFYHTETITRLTSKDEADSAYGAIQGSIDGDTVQSWFSKNNTYVDELSDYEMLGDVIGITAILTKEDGSTKEVTVSTALVDGAQVDLSHDAGAIRGKEFSVILPRSEVGEYDEVKDLRFVYQRIDVRMDGKWYDGFQGLIEIGYDESQEETYCKTYDCDYETCNPPSIYCDAYNAPSRTIGHTDPNGDSITEDNAGGKHESKHYHCGRHDGYVNCDDTGHSIPEHYHGDGTCNTAACDHTHDSSCCSKSGDHSKHTCDHKNCSHMHYHTDSCYSNGHLICGYSEGEHYYPAGCCSKTEHTHSEACHWHDEVNPGCSTQQQCHYQYYFTCDHDHEICKHEKYVFNEDSCSLENARNVCQDGITLSAELVPEKIEYTVHVNVPMRTKMLITKGIVKTFHPGEPDVTDDTYENETERLLQFATDTRNGHTGLFTTFEGMTMAQKLADPLKVERGDYVWFKIIVGNESRFKTIVKLKDVIYKEVGGAQYQLFAANNQGTIIYYENGDVSEQLNNADQEVTIDAYTQLTYWAKVRPREPVGTYTNKVFFTTTNHGEEHMKYVEWGDPSVGGANSTYWKGSIKPNRHGNIVNDYANDLLNNAKDLEVDSDTYKIKEYTVNLEKYVSEVNHKNEAATTASGLDTTFDGEANNGYVSNTPTRSYLLNHESVKTKDPLIAHENYKESAPVYVEYGDDVTYNIDIYNTCSPFLTEAERAAEPYYNPNKVYVYVEDTLPENVTDIRVKILCISADGSESELDSSQYGYEQNGDTLLFKNVMVPAGGKSRIQVTVTLENQDRDTIQVNNAKLDITKIRNINKGPGPSDIGDTTYTVTDFLDLVEKEANHYLIVDSSDWTIFNEYHAIITKYLSDYEDVMTADNNSKEFTNETNSYIDNLRKHIRYTYTENEKKDHPLNAEKGDNVVFTIKVTNMSINEAVENRNDYKDLYSPGKPNTQVRPSKIYDYAQEGLDLDKFSNQIYATIYEVNMDGTLKVDGSGNPIPVSRYTDKIPVTVTYLDTVLRKDGFGDDQKFRKFSLEISDDYILNPQECIIYTVKAYVNKSNMYLYTLENSAELGILTNINCDDNGNGHNRIVKEDSDENPNAKNQNVAGKTVTHQSDTPGKYYIGTDISRDYVKLKDLVIAGKVWVDNTPDGLYALQSGDINGASVETDKLKPNVIVKLYAIINGKAELYRQTKTDENGMYTFGRMPDGSAYYDGDYDIEGTGSYTAASGQGGEPSGNSSNLKTKESRERVPKTTPFIKNDPTGETNTGLRDTDEKDADYKLNYKRTNPPPAYAKYYIEFEYDGLYYKATDLYSYDDNLAENGDKEAWTPLTIDTSSSPSTISTNTNLKYVNDSNAYEFWDERKELDSHFETIGYDIAYGGGDENQIGDEPTIEFHDEDELLEYEKGAPFSADHFRQGDRDVSIEDGSAHISELLEREDLEEHPDRKMKARSFIHGDPERNSDGSLNLDISRDTKSDQFGNYLTDADNFGNTKLLYLFDLSQADYKLPETEYLKYINLGLVKREKVDISIVKDVYQVKVTVNGEEIIYTFNEQGEISTVQGNEAIIQDIFQCTKDYNIELYEDDYNYRYSNYTIQKVKDYKKALSEMNVEVTYRITVTNNSVTDYDTNYENLDERDIPLYVRINEIADYYDDNFIKYTDQAETFDSSHNYDHTKYGDLPNLDGGNNNDWTGYTQGNDYVAMQKKAGDFLEVKQTKVVEAWRYADESDEKSRIDLEVHNKSLYNSKREIDGYNTLFITGLDGNKGVIDPGVDGNDGIRLYEKAFDGHINSVNLYIKYVVDKDTNSTSTGEDAGYYNMDIQDTDYRVLTALRQLKIFERYDDGEAIVTLPGQREGFSGQESKVDDSKQIKDMGIEGIAEINAFSAYYGDIASYPAFYNKRPQYKHYADRPAGTVDRDSNPSNIGEEPTERSFIGSVPTYGSTWSPKFGANPGEAAIYYEDDTFKTGIKFVLPYDPRVRTITGMTWDDTRNATVDEDENERSAEARKQYNGNGIYNPSIDASGNYDDNENNGKDKRLTVAGANENIKNLYNELDSNDAKDNAFKTEIGKVNDLGNNNYEKTDFLINEVKTQLVEVVKIPIYEGNTLTEMRYYEEPALKTGHYKDLDPSDPGYDQAPWKLGTSEIMTRSGNDEDLGTGKYKLSGFVPGYYIVRFFYGDETSSEMLTYNGQDYKSTKYTATYEPKAGQTEGDSIESFTLSSGAYYDDELGRVIYSEETPLHVVEAQYDENDNYTITVTNDITEPSPTLAEKYDTLLEALTNANRNDARDDEISRLNAIGYSEVMTNAKAEILKGISSQTQYVDIVNKEAAKNDPTAGSASSTILQPNTAPTNLLIQTDVKMNSELVANTAMNAETVTFYVKPEKVNENVSYSGREKLEGDDRRARDDDRNIYQINNIDFGLVYRPEAQMTIDKEIENIVITTSDNTDILRISFKDKIVDNPNTGNKEVVIDPYTGRMKRVVDLDNSIGLDKLQYIFNEDQIPTQGFFYINIDDEILQGCTINVEYALRAENISEIDRISSNLDILRYKENVTDSVLNRVGDHYVNIGLTNPFRFESGLVIKNGNEYLTYSGSKTAEGLLYNKWFDIDEDARYKDDGEFRRAEKTMTKDENNKYYGSFLGGAYYTNNVLRVSTNHDDIIDTYVDLKIDKILDYLDNDFVFSQEDNEDTDHRWAPITAEYLYSGDGYNGRLIKNTSLIMNKADDGTELYGYDEYSRVVLKSDNSTYPDLENTDVFTILDKDKVSYEKDGLSNLVISVDDRVVDDKYTTSSRYSGVTQVGSIGVAYEGKSHLTTTNPSLSRYLEPKVDVNLSDAIVNVKGEASYYKTQQYNLNKDTQDQYAGKIFLTGKRIIAAETDTENLAFDNIAEVIQYSATNGRRTNFKTTLGDAEVSNKNGVYPESMISHKHDPDKPKDPTAEIPDPKDPDTSAVELITLSPPTGLDRIQRIMRNAVKTTSRIVVPALIGIVMISCTLGTIAIIKKKNKSSNKS